jgi:cytochrome c-type biogenesis protein CcmH
VIVFSVICALLRHPDRIAPTSTTSEANMAVYRAELAEMESDLRQRIMTNEQFVLDRDELEKRLSVDFPKESRTSRKERPVPGSKILIYALAVGVPLTAILLYLALGTPPSK